MKSEDLLAGLCLYPPLFQLADYMTHRPPSNGGGKACTDVSVPDKLQTWLDRDDF